MSSSSSPSSSNNNSMSSKQHQSSRHGGTPSNNRNRHRPVTPTGVGSSSNNVTRGPGWRTKPPVKPRVQHEFWHRPFAQVGTNQQPPQFTPVEEGYMIGYMDSRDFHFRKIQRKCVYKLRIKSLNTVVI